MVTLLVFHFDILGKEIKEEHPLNTELISSISFVLNLDISGIDIREEHL